MSAINRAMSAWGDDLPDWVRVLAEACAARGQKRLATDLGYSPTVINQVLGNKYPGDMAGVQQAVEGLLMAHTVHCPVLGEMRADICLRHQKAPFMATNSTRVKLYKGCHGGQCPNSRIGGK